MIKYLPYVLLFAVITALLYGWGLKKNQRQQQDLNAQLYSKCTRKIKKAIRRSGPITRQEIEKLVSGTQAGQFYSKQKLIVTQPEVFTDDLLKFLQNRHILSCKIKNKIEYYDLFQ